jgi:hypothetical protein
MPDARRLLLLSPIIPAPRGMDWRCAGHFDVDSRSVSDRRSIRRRRPFRSRATVRDTASQYRDADPVVIPLRAGGGTCIKLLEAAAHRVSVVSPTLGAEGTTCRCGHELLLANSEVRFAQACATLLQDDQRTEVRSGERTRRSLRNTTPLAVRDISGTWWQRFWEDGSRCRTS